MSKKAITVAQTSQEVSEIANKNANSNALKAIKISEEAINLSKEANSINKVNAENLLSLHRDNFIEIDEKLKDWEQGKGLKRTGISPQSIEEMQSELTELNLSIPAEIIKIYKKRQREYETLSFMVETYQPFKERFSKLDLTLPALPNLPSFSPFKLISLQKLKCNFAGFLAPCNQFLIDNELKLNNLIGPTSHVINCPKTPEIKLPIKLYEITAVRHAN